MRTITTKLASTARPVVGASLTHFVVSGDLERGKIATAVIDAGATAIQIDVRERVSIDTAAEKIRKEFGGLDLLVDNAAISNTNRGEESIVEYAKKTVASVVFLDEVRAVWETNVFGALSVYQAMLSLLRKSFLHSACGREDKEAKFEFLFRMGGTAWPALTACPWVFSIILNRLVDPSSAAWHGSIF